MTPEDPFNLNRFLSIQIRQYDIALQEIATGKKISHWMWYIFPQFNGLGKSISASVYSIHSMEEAQAYFVHPILGKRLIEITEIFYRIENKSAVEILGYTDALKMNSCMTLFASIQDEITIFKKVIEKFYENNYCSTTMKLIL
jgi:uncharacterized protein (DUF1810 family)